MSDAYDRIREGLNEALAFVQGEKTGAILQEIAVPRVDPFIPSEVEGCAARAGVSTSLDMNGGWCKLKSSGSKPQTAPASAGATNIPIQCQLPEIFKVF